jgi:hypothetical protein
MGGAFDEATVLRVAHAYESATAWHRQTPTLQHQSHHKATEATP